jgi:putative PIN family toxin of toxin-antitoxin system
LLRDKFNCWRALDERMAWYDLYAESTKLLPITVNVSDCRDPKDDKFLSLALAANVDVIVSSDEDLRVLHPYRGIAIVDVVTFSQQYL